MNESKLKNKLKSFFELPFFLVPNPAGIGHEIGRPDHILHYGPYSMYIESKTKKGKLSKKQKAWIEYHLKYNIPISIATEFNNDIKLISLNSNREIVLDNFKSFKIWFLYEVLNDTISITN